MWSEIRLEALNLISRIKTHAQLTDVDKYILGTGYQWAPNPHESTIDLLTVYAANLRNTSGNGPSIKAFSLMVRAAIIGQDVLQENYLTRPLEVSSFSKACADYLCTESAISLAEDTQIDYHGDLIALSAGSERNKAILNGLIRSIAGFSQVLVNLYGGSAQKFHVNIDCAYDESKPTDFVVSSYEKVKHLNGVGGVALAMNFFKDSQVPSKKGTALSKLVDTHVGWYVKPDMHILRFMLAATGRAESANLLDEDLIHLDQGEATKIYTNFNPRKSWSSMPYTFDRNQPSSKAGQWRCVEDVHRFAKYLKISPLEIDRILFMIGSGNVGEGIRDSSSQKSRYLRLLPLIRATAGENTVELKSNIYPLDAPVKFRHKSFTPKNSTVPTGEVVLKKLKMGEWRGKVKLLKILKKLVSKDQDLIEAQKLIFLLTSQKATKPSKSETFFEAVCQALDSGVTLANFVKCAEGIPVESYDTQVKFIVKGNDIVSRRN